MLSKEFIQDNFPKGEVTIVAGRPFIGKTSFAVSLAFSLVGYGYSPAYFCLEMSCEKLVCKISRYKREKALGEEFGELLYDDRPRLTVKEIRQSVENNSADFVIIDFLQLVFSDPQILIRKMELRNIIQELKDMAQELNIPVIVMARLCRKTDRSIHIRPDLSDVKNEISEYVDDVNIAVLHRPEYYNNFARYSNGKVAKGKTEFISYKGIESRTTYLYFNEDTLEMSNWLTRQRLRDEIVNTDKWRISLDEGDLKEIDDGLEENVIVFEVETEDTTVGRFRTLLDSIRQVLESSKAMEQEVPRMLMLIQLPLSAPAKMSEMNLICDFLKELIPPEKDCLIKWGISLSESNISRIIGEVRIR